jgi:VCBS repeat-containing protein
MKTYSRSHHQQGEITRTAGQSLDFDSIDQYLLQISGTDGVNSDDAKITIDILDSNTAPSPANDSGTLNENATLSRSAENGIVQSNDTDAEGDSLTISQFQTGSTDNPSAVIGAFGVPLDGDYGQLSLQANGSFDYVANRATADALTTGESASDTFSYTVSDGKLSETAEIDFTINGINDAPDLVDAIKTKKYTEGQSNVTIIDGSLTIRDVDDINIENGSVSITDDFQTTEDTLAFTNNFGITGSWNQSTGVLSLTGSATKTNYESALQTVTYTNTNNTNPVLGLRTITWSINDGESSSNSITSQVDVGGINDSPEAFNEAVAVNAGSTVSTPSQSSLLANDTDPESDALAIHSFRVGAEQTSNPDFAAGATITALYGALTIEANGQYSYHANQNAAQRLLSGETRTEAFNYTVRDVNNAEDVGEIVFTVTGINDSPIASDDSKEISENANKFFTNIEGLLVNDTDLDGDPLQITDIEIGPQTANILNSSSLGNSIQGTYGSLTLDSDGSLRFNANSSNADALDEGDIGTDVFTYTLSDSELEDKAEISFKVTGLNDTPVLSIITRGTIADQRNSTDLITNNLSGHLTATDLDASAVLSYGVSSVSTTDSIKSTLNTPTSSPYSNARDNSNYIFIFNLQGW